MPVTNFERDLLRPATLDDAELVADLESTRDPSEPRDPVLLRHWWQMSDEQGQTMRRIAVRDGQAVAYIGASHDPWADGEKRFGTVRPLLLHSEWTDDAYTHLVAVGEEWLRKEGAERSVARMRGDFPRELAVLDRLGFQEERRMRRSELDLVEHRARILDTVQECRRKMREQGVEIHPLSEDTDPERYRKLYAAMLESELDIPTSVPWRELTFEEWRRYWFDNPAIREERFWIARQGDTIVGTSVLDCPVVRGVPWTAYTGTVRSVRGRGIARALKYESMAQAISAGYARVRTNNDADNPPILRINEEMGYRLITPVIELHHELGR